MVKIVRIDDDKVAKEKLCTGCGAVLSYMPREVKFSVSKDISGVSDKYYWIVCPNCSNNVSVPYTRYAVKA